MTLVSEGPAGVGAATQGDLQKAKVSEAWQLSEQVIGWLLAMVVDAMSGMVTQVRPPRRDEMNAYYRALPLCDPGKLHPNRHTGDANA